jgi:hypothetical protein
MEDILQLVPLPGINGRDRFGIHNDRNKKIKIAAGQASWWSVTDKNWAGNVYITTQIPYADFPPSS